MTTVFKVVGYEIKTAEGQFLSSTVFWVYAKTGAEAEKRARSYEVKKKYYEVLEVIEKNEDVAT